MRSADMLRRGSEVASAMADGRPVLALESTIICHGMPYPANLETAMAIEQTVREAGAVPATVAVMGGRLRLGLGKAEIERLARAGTDVPKCSRRDMAVLLNRGLTGATTVAATMLVAAMAGIRVFATGGIGGVHRGGGSSLDISADLQELARTPVAVVCAGPKSIIDVGLTLEYLETHGVPVIGYRCDEMPAFYTRNSGFSVDYRLNTPAEIASVLNTGISLGLEGGVVIANPVPAECAMGREKVEQAVERAIEEAQQQGISGKRLTPLLLQRIAEMTGGASLETNIALVKNNARLGAEIAVALTQLERARD